MLVPSAMREPVQEIPQLHLCLAYHRSVTAVEQQHGYKIINTTGPVVQMIEISNKLSAELHRVK